MPAGFVTIPVLDAAGISRSFRKWSDSGAVDGNLYDVYVDPNTGLPINPASTVSVAGADAHDAVPAANPFGQGVLASTALPTAVANGDMVRLIGDIYGRMIAMPALREQIGVQFTTISSTSETTIVTAASGIKNDLVALLISNTHASTDANVTIKDGTAGTTVGVIPAVHAQPPAGFTIGFPIPAAAANTNWTATCSGSATVNVTAIYIKNK
jgi:hypothetical protein